jgi:hypothetical protein
MIILRSVIFFVALLLSLSCCGVEAFILPNKNERVNVGRAKENQIKKKEAKTVVFSSRTPMRDDGEYIQPDNIFSKTGLWQDRDYVLIAARKMHNALASAPAYRGDREIVMIAVSNFGFALQYVDPILAKYREVVLAAVTNHGDALAMVNGPLTADREIVEIAVANWVGSIQFAANVLRNDKALNMEFIDKYGHEMYEYLSDALKNDPDVTTKCVSIDGMLLKYASEKMKNDGRVVKAAVTQNGYALQHASEDMRKDKDIVTTAVRCQGQALRFASLVLQLDPELKRMRIDSLSKRTSRWGNLYRLGNDLDLRN